VLFEKKDTQHAVSQKTARTSRPVNRGVMSQIERREMKKARYESRSGLEFSRPTYRTGRLGRRAVPTRPDTRCALRKRLKMAILLAVFILTGIPIAIAQPRQTVAKSPIQRKIPQTELKLKTFTYNGIQGSCEQPPPQASQEGAVGNAPPPGMPLFMLSDLTVMGVKHMFVNRDGKEYVKVVTKIANNSDEPMRTSEYKVFFKIGGEKNACVATLPQLDAHRIVNLSREVQLRRGLNYRVTVIADFFGTEQEANENNNKFTYTIRMK
jgi:hypothetical protein